MQTAARNYLWLVIALVIWSAPTSARETKPNGSQLSESTLPPVEVWNLLEDNPSIVTRVDDLPESVRTALAKVFHQAELEMGDRDHQVNAHCDDCMVFRLIFAGIASNGCFVHYSATGLFTSDIIIVFDIAGQKGARPLWAARGVRADDLEELRSRIAEGKFHPFSIQPAPRR
jgi:hypothetical protein